MEQLEKIKKQSNDISDLIDEIQQNSCFEPEFIKPCFLKLMKKVSKLNKKIKKL